MILQNQIMTFIDEDGDEVSSMVDQFDALLWAVQSADREAALFWLKNGADINVFFTADGHFSVLGDLVCQPIHNLDSYRLAIDLGASTKNVGHGYTAKNLLTIKSLEYEAYLIDKGIPQEIIDYREERYLKVFNFLSDVEKEER